MVSCKQDPRNINLIDLNSNNLLNNSYWKAYSFRATQQSSASVQVLSSAVCRVEANIRRSTWNLRLTDRQTGTDGWAYARTDRQIDRQTYIQGLENEKHDRQTDRKRDGLTDRQTNWWIYRWTEIKADRQVDRRKDSQIDTHTSCEDRPRH
jgi:hypothetical protein